MLLSRRARSSSRALGRRRASARNFVFVAIVPSLAARPRSHARARAFRGARTTTRRDDAHDAAPPAAAYPVPRYKIGTTAIVTDGDPAASHVGS